MFQVALIPPPLTGSNHRLPFTHAMTARLDTIDEDVLECIFWFVNPPRMHVKPTDLLFYDHNARSFAAVSRHFHEFCASRIYKNVPWVWRELKHGFVPESLWIYVRRLHVQLCGSNDTDALYQADPPPGMPEQLERALPHMPALETLRISIAGHRRHGVWPSLLQSLRLSVCLKSLEVDAQWRYSRESLAPINLDSGLALERFVYDASLAPIEHTNREANPGKRTSEQCQVETHNLQLLLDHCRGTLKTLELPAEISAEILRRPFPCLTDLTLRGYSPPLPRNIHSLWLSAVSLGSMLRNLDLQMIPCRDVVPDEDHSNFPVHCLSHLQSLTLSAINYMPNDPILQALPSTVTRLSLNPYPLPLDPDECDDWKIPTYIVSGGDLLRILGFGTFSNLDSLELSYRWNGDNYEMAILAALPGCSPYLRTLEFNRYEAPGRGLDFMLPLQQGLRNLHCLEKLSLNLEKIPPPIYVRHLDSFWEDIVSQERNARIRELGACVPSLRHISYLGMARRRRMTWVWTTWEVVRRDNNDVELVFAGNSDDIW
ncbi:uncharacterized protein ARMOST_12557 [Armillaria ostoyae]|uniref:F-box domain-containing protein n=1 Tax=Armillaria ostoyae TaxID=47428 RepID=A0A284RK93_ARMOS|nr:uncharacterized protein ARMOST_12557 [Armillaria ostoyae]